MYPPSPNYSCSDDDGDSLNAVLSSEGDEEIFHKKSKHDNDFVEAVPVIGCHQNFTDCSNVFKAFIGSAMIGLPFAVHQAGIGLAIIGIMLIAMATDHCCVLIVKCKRLVIADILNREKLDGATASELKTKEDILGRTLSFGRIGKACLGRVGVLSVNTSILVTQFGFSIGYFIFLGNTMRSILKTFLLTYSPYGNITSASTAMPPITTTPLTTLPPATTNSSRINTTSQPMLSHVLHHIHNLVKEPLSAQNLISNSSSTFALLLVAPFLVLVLISFIRQLRKLGPISMLANAAILSAFAATATYIVFKMKSISPDIEYFKFATFPIFFGQVTGAFEGIGTVIPIEGSMAENRPRYPVFLHCSLTGVSTILATFGVIGYISYGDHTCQIVTSNLHGVIAIILQILLFIGVLFTYPLQIYPCIQIIEHLILKYRKYRLQKTSQYKLNKSQLSEKSLNDEVETLMNDQERTFDEPLHRELKLKTWEGNLVRASLVTFTAAVAVCFRSQFAYMASLTGSIGSSLLLYILPPIFHISLRRKRMRWWILCKNIFFIVFGITGGLIGLKVTVQEIVESFDKGHPHHC